MCQLAMAELENIGSILVGEAMLVDSIITEYFLISIIPAISERCESVDPRWKLLALMHCFPDQSCA